MWLLPFLMHVKFLSAESLAESHASCLKPSLIFKGSSLSRSLVRMEQFTLFCFQNLLLMYVFVITSRVYQKYVWIRSQARTRV